MSYRVASKHSRLPGRRRAAAVGLVGFTVLAILMFCIPHAGAAFKYLKAGMEVPDFSLKTIDGQEFTLAQFKGQPATLLIFWATWSPRSQPALESAQKLYAQYAEKGFKVLAVNVNKLSLGMEDRKEINETKSKLGLTFPIVIDAGLETYNIFGVVATPSTAVLDSEGRIVHETASWLSGTGSDIQEAVEILLGLRQPSKVEVTASKPVYKPDSIALRHFNFGRNLLRLKSLEKAQVKFEEAVAADPKYAAPKVLLGHLLIAKKDPDSIQKAADLFKQAVDLDPENVAARTGYGEALLESGKIDEAAAAFEEAVKLDPTYTPAVSNLALVFAKQGKSAEAEEKFKSALELNPVDPGTYFRRGQSWEAVGNLKGAAADYRRSIEILMNLPRTGDEV